MFYKVYLGFREEAKKRAEEKKNNLESRSLKEVNVVDNSSPKNQPKKDNGTRNPRKRSKITDYIDHEVIYQVFCVTEYLKPMHITLY